MNKQAWIDCAFSKGFTSFEIYQETSEEKTTTWYDHQLDSFVTSHVLGTGLRGVANGKMVNMATESSDDAQMETIIGAMLEQSAAITSDDVGILRRPEAVEPIISAREWVAPSGSEVQELLQAAENKLIAYDPRILQVTDLSWNVVTERRELVNSNGICLNDENKAQVFVAGVAVSEGGDIKTDYKIETVERLDTFDLDAFVKELCDGALGKLNATSLPSGSYPVILERSAMTSLFTAFAGMFSGDLISKGISPIKDKLGEQIFSDCITVIDDPRNNGALQPAAFDDEGCPTRTKTLVENGVFRTMLHSSQSAARMQTESTGNGFKGSYASPVDVSPRNCYIVPGEKSLDELCAEMKEGFVIKEFQGLHAGVNFITTNFSLQSSGYWVKDGKRDHSVTLVTAAGNFLDLMKNVVAVGSDLKWKTNTIACPSIAFRSCAISGE